MKTVIDQVLPLLAAGGDAAMLVVGWVLIRNERRLSRLEFKVFGFDLGRKPG